MQRLKKKDKSYPKDLKVQESRRNRAVGGYTAKGLTLSSFASSAPRKFNVQKEVGRLLRDEYAPSAILLNSEERIVQFYGYAGRYLNPAPGIAGFNLVDWAPERLFQELKRGMRQARQKNQVVVRAGVPLTSRGVSRQIQVKVRPIRLPSSSEPYFLVLFLDEKDSIPPATPAQPKRKYRQAQEPRKQFEEGRAELRKVIAELEERNEELRTANEETQNTNEELATAREELQVANEELTTLNEELQERNVRLALANNDLNNVLKNMNVAMVILDDDLRIRRFTPAAAKAFGLLPEHVGTQITGLRATKDFPDLQALFSESIATGSLKEQQVRDRAGRWHLLRVRPYTTDQRKIEGAVATLVDIDEVKSEAAESHQYAQAIVETVRSAILVLDPDLRVKTANRAFFETFQAPPREIEDRFLYEVQNGQWNIPPLIEQLKNILPQQSEFKDFEVEQEFGTIGRRTMVLSARQVRHRHGLPLILLSIEDVTESKRAQEKQRESEERFRLLVEQVRDYAIIMLDPQGYVQSWNAGAERIKGYRAAEIIGKHFSCFFTPKDVQAGRPARVLSVAKLEGRFEDEGWRVRKGGSSFWANVVTTALRDPSGTLRGFIKVTRDMTERQRAEESLSRLSGRLLKLQDEERRRIARELHDSTSQTLSALALTLSAIQHRTSGLGADVLKALSEAEGLAEQASNEIRDISHLLHPPDLDQVGLAAAIEWHVRRFAGRTGLQVDLELPCHFGRLNPDHEIALFRVVQEGLTNVYRHSGSSTARIRLALRGGAVDLQIEDKGRGMPVSTLDLTHSCNSDVGVGIRGMQERIHQLGGRLEVRSGPSGTCITANLPLDEDTDSREN